MRSRALRSFGWILVLCVGAGGLASAQTAPAKKPLTYAAYDGWRTIQSSRLSRDGAWLAYTLAPQDGDAELVVRNLKSDREFRQPRGTGAEITADSRYVLFTVVPSKAETEAARKAKTPPDRQPKNALGILSLADGALQTVPRIKSFRLAEEGSRSVACLLEKPLPATPAPAAPAAPKASDSEPDQATETPAAAPAKKKDPGTELVIRELGTGTQTTVPEVTDYAWNKPGSWLTYTVSSATPAKDGVYARRSTDGATQALMTGVGNYRSLTWDEAGGQLAFLSDRDDYQAETPSHKLYYWDGKSERAAELAATSSPGLLKSWLVSENRALRFSKDGHRLFFGTAPAPKKRPKDAPDVINVDIWNWKDPYLQPMQKVRAEQEKRRTYLAVAHLRDRRLVQLATSEVPDVRPTDDDSWTLGDSDLPYRQLLSWDDGYSDIYLVSLKDGAKEKIVPRSSRSATLSPGGKYALYFDGQTDAYHLRRVRDGRVTNLTGKLEVPFVDETWDTPSKPAPYGVAGWTEGDRSVLLYDRFDVWECPTDGGAPRMVTRGAGRARNLVFRYQQLDPEERTIPSGRPLLLATTDDRTKATGFYRASLSGDAEPEKIVMLDKAFAAVSKAKNADVLSFRLQRFDEYPDLWTSDLGFSGMRKISDANPQQSQYVWGRSELIEYSSTDGKPLRAILTKPENFDPLKRYPLMVYIYETRTEGLHQYISPAPGTNVNLTRYVSNGYLVLQPDIVYTTGYPGESAMKCVLPAIQKVVDSGIVDRARIGIQGHSWGGYQISYMVTRTNMFRAVEAGASVVNMVSAYGGIRWTTGMSRAFQYEKTQSRIGGAPWERPLQFIENSPIFWADKVQTPYLTLHNDADGAVPWYQGIEFFTALRRLGREAYLFNYNGEDHGLRSRANMKHWTIHLDEFFDHYLKGAPRPDWMENGVPYLDRGTRDTVAPYK